MLSKDKLKYPTEITDEQLRYLITAFENNMAEFYPIGREAEIARQLLSLREQNLTLSHQLDVMTAAAQALRDEMYKGDAKLEALAAAGETCWSCGKYFTYLQHTECDGFCPHCDAEVELMPSALAVPDIKTIQDNLIEQVGLMCDRATNIHEKNVYGEAFCVLKYGILPYLRKQGKQ